MTFFNIIIKNFKFNFRKYVSYLFVNSFIITILILYSNLIFNDYIKKELSQSILFGVIKLTSIVLVCFSISFISYSTITFTKNRGKEFGILLTLGLNTKVLNRIILVENLFVSIISFIFGLICSTIFSKIFFNLFSYYLKIDIIPFTFEYKSILLTVFIYIVIFIICTKSTTKYISCMDVIEIIKSKTKKEVGSSKASYTIIGLILIGISIVFISIILKEGQLTNIKTILVSSCVASLIICPYLIISGLISTCIKFLKNKEKVYNKNLLVLSNLKYRFEAYKNILYMVTILLASAILFLGSAFTYYKRIETEINKKIPYDITFINNEHVKFNGSEIENILNDKKVPILKKISINYLNINAKLINNNENFKKDIFLIDESTFRKLSNLSIDINDNEFIQIINDESFQDKDIISELNISTDNVTLNLKNKKTIANILIDTNYFTKVFKCNKIFVIKDIAFADISKQNKNIIKCIDMFNVKKCDENVYKEILYKFNENNNVNLIYEDILLKNVPRSNKSIFFRPSFKAENLSFENKYFGITYFSMLFLGIIFLLSSCVVIYFKIANDLYDEKKRVYKMRILGMNSKEIREVLFKEMKILFITPDILGGILGLCLIYLVFTKDQLQIKSILDSINILILYLLMQIPFYFLCKIKFIKKLKL